MQRGIVIGLATATIKHPSLQGWKMVLIQPLIGNQIDGDPVLAIDSLGCSVFDYVVISSDGQEVRDMVGMKNTPIRWFIQAIQDRT